MRMRHTLISVACPATQSFPRYVINGTIFGGKKATNMRRASIFSTYLYTTFLILSRNGRDMIKNVLYWSS
jgi:hypothetical protein